MVCVQPGPAGDQVMAEIVHPMRHTIGFSMCARRTIGLTGVLLQILPRVDLLNAPVDGFLQFDQLGIGVVVADLMQRFL